MEGIRKTEGWRRVAAGEYEVYRDGPRKILISVRSILQRRKRQLRKADFSTSRSQKGTRGFVAKADAVTA